MGTIGEESGGWDRNSFNSEKVEFIIYPKVHLTGIRFSDSSKEKGKAQMAGSYPATLPTNSWRRYRGATVEATGRTWDSKTFPRVSYTPGASSTTSSRKGLGTDRRRLPASKSYDPSPQVSQKWLMIKTTLCSGPDTERHFPPKKKAFILKN